MFFPKWGRRGKEICIAFLKKISYNEKALFERENLVGYQRQEQRVLSHADVRILCDRTP